MPSRFARISFRASALLVAFFLVAATAVAQDKPGVKKFAALTYGKAGDTELQLDLMEPPGEGPFPAILFVHGGGWAHGSRVGHHKHIEEAAKRGYVAATVTYRLVEENKDGSGPKYKNTWPAQIHDVKAAVRWLRANAEKYHIDPERIGAIGFSAGGHLVLLLGTTDADDGLEGDSGNPEPSSRVQCVVNFFGPTEMVSGRNNSSVAHLYENFLGGKPDEASENYKAASPVTYVTKDDPPILTLHGDQDKLVPVSNARDLDAAMQKAGAEHTLSIIEGAGHGFSGANGERAQRESWEFFEKHLKPAGK